MNEREPLKKNKKSSETGNWLGPLLIFIFLIITGIFLYFHFSPPSIKSFEVRKKDENTLEVSGLNQEEIDKID